jgi:hypothetical protein
MRDSMTLANARRGRGGASGKTGTPLTPPMWLPVDEWATPEHGELVCRSGNCHCPGAELSLCVLLHRHPDVFLGFEDSRWDAVSILARTEPGHVSADDEAPGDPRSMPGESGHRAPDPSGAFDRIVVDTPEVRTGCVI